MSWDDGSSDNPRAVYVTGDMYFTAYFVSDDRYCVSVLASDSAGGFVFGSGMYESGSIATVGAFAKDNYTFMGWGDGVRENPRRFVVTGDVLLLAVFDYGDAVMEYRSDGVVVYPNPVDEEINILSESVISMVEIISLTGQVLYSQNVASENVVINVGDLPSGAYFARFWFDGEKLPANIKFVKR